MIEAIIVRKSYLLTWTCVQSYSSIIQALLYSFLSDFLKSFTCNNRKCLLCAWGCFLLRSQIFDQEQGYWTRVTFSFYHKFLKIVVCFLLCGTAVDITTDLQWSEDSLLVKRSLIKESLMPPNREKYSFMPRSKNSSYRSHQNCISNDWSGPPNTNGFLKHGFWQTGVIPTGNLYIWSTSVILSTLSQICQYQIFSFVHSQNDTLF